MLVTARFEGNDYEITNSLWRSTDLTSWTELELPGAPAIGFRSIMATPDGTLLAVAIDWDTDEHHWYRSTDDGASFEPIDRPVPRTLTWGLGPVGDSLLVMTEPSYDDAYPSDDVQTGPVMQATVDGLSWEPIERNTGLWGDGLTDPSRLATTGSNRYTVVARTLREDDRYCFDDLGTCEQRGRILVAVQEDLTFRPVAVELEPAARFVVAGDDGSLLLWGDQWREDE